MLRPESLIERSPQGIAAEISRLAHDGTLAAGERLPTVRQVAAALGVSAGTVATAWRALADAGVNVLSAAISTDRQGVAYLRFLFELGSMDQLQKVLATVRGVNGVFDARRTMPDNSKKRGGPACG